MTRHALRTARGIALALAAAVGPTAPAAAAAPQRIVSLHLCADQLLLGLADRGQIASLSRFAADPERSYLAARAAGLPRNLGTAEEVVALHADLVLAGAQSARPTVAALIRLGYRVIDLPLAQDFAAIRRQTMRVALALGHPERGAALVADMDRRLAAATEDVRGPRPVAAIWQPGGFTSGLGTLEHEVLAAAGIDNLATKLGIRGLGRLPLERLVLEAPDLIVNWMGAEDAPSLARDSLNHPALRRAVRGGPVVPVPPKLWTCGAWFTAEAVALLAGARRRLHSGGVRSERLNSLDRGTVSPLRLGEGRDPSVLCTDGEGEVAKLGFCPATHLTRPLRGHPLPPQAGGEGILRPTASAPPHSARAKPGMEHTLTKGVP